MAVVSKPLAVKLKNTCYELGHTWSPSCKQASIDVFFEVLRYSLKIYGSLYIIAGIAQGKSKEYFIKIFPAQFLRSVAFLTTNGTLFITFFCIWRKLTGFYCYLATFATGIPASAVALCFERKSRKLFGHFYYPSISFVPALTASYVAILVERKSRRGLLATYMANVATETVFRMLAARGIVNPVPNGEVILFSLASAVYLYLFRKNSLPPSVSSTFRKLLGREEQSSYVLSEDSKPPRQNKIQQWFSNQKHVQTAVRWLDNGVKHKLCRHHCSCVFYVLKGFIKNFCVGFGIQAAVRILGSFSSIIRKPMTFLYALKHRDNFNLGAFLGFFVAIFRAVNCILRALRGKDDDVHGLVAGFLAAWSMLWYKSQTIALYAAFKLSEILYFKGISKGILPYIRCADIIIYAVSTAIVFHVAVVEPHNLRPSYWKFLLIVTGKRFGMMNRRLLLPYLPYAANIQPDFWPDYDYRYTNLVKPPDTTSVLKGVS